MSPKTMCLTNIGIVGLHTKKSGAPGTFAAFTIGEERLYCTLSRFLTDASIRVNGLFSNGLRRGQQLGSLSFLISPTIKDCVTNCYPEFAFVLQQKKYKLRQAQK